MITSNKLLPVHKRFDLSFSHGKGMYLFSEGKRYLDLGAGIAVNSLGHCHPAMIEAIERQARTLWHISNIYNSEPLNNYAEKLVAATFADLVFFCNSGAESIECAIKMARRHFFFRGLKEKNRIITFEGAFHGRTIATISAAGKKKYLEGFEPALEGFDCVEFNNIEAVKSAIKPSTAAILIEPIQGEEGIRVSNPEFIKQLRDLCDKNDLLLMFDEVQCGMGRLGHLFAYEFYGVTPDIISTAKGIGGGFPLGACLATKHAACGMSFGTHGTTYGGNPLAMAVAWAVLDTILSNGFLDLVKTNSNLLKKQLIELQKQFPRLISEVRGVGLMLGLKINDEVEHATIVQKFIDNGLLTVPAGNNVIRIIPPLIINQSNIEEAADIMRRSFKEMNIE